MILGKSVPVRLKVPTKGEDGSETLGEFIYKTNEILINPSLSVEQARSTVFHELVHVALAYSGHAEMLSPEQEEAVVCAIETAFYPYIIDFVKLTNNNNNSDATEPTAIKHSSP